MSHFCTNLQLSCKLDNQETIRKFLAFVLLLVFTFSATPKKYLHDLVADHTDLPAAQLDQQTKVIVKAGFNCQCEDLVVSTPFIEAAFSTEISLPKLHMEAAAASCREVNLTTQYAKDLRGPPGMA